MIQVTCECGQCLDVPAEYAGTRVVCPACKRSVAVPTPKAVPRPQSTGKRAEREARAYAGFLRRIRLLGILLGASMLATLAIPLPGGRRMMFLWQALDSAPMAIFLISTWVVGAGTVVAALALRDSRQATAYACLGALALLLPVTAIGVAAVQAPASESTPAESESAESGTIAGTLHGILTVAGLVSTFVLLATMHIHAQLGSSKARRVITWVAGGTVAGAFGPLSFRAIRWAFLIPDVLMPVPLPIGVTVSLRPVLIVIAMVATPLGIAGLVAACQAYWQKSASALAIITVRLIYLGLIVQSLFLLYTPFRTTLRPVEALGLGLQANLLGITRPLLAVLGVVAFVVVRARRQPAQSPGTEDVPTVAEE